MANTLGISAIRTLVICTFGVAAVAGWLHIAKADKPVITVAEPAVVESVAYIDVFDGLAIQPTRFTKPTVTKAEFKESKPELILTSLNSSVFERELTVKRKRSNEYEKDSQFTCESEAALCRPANGHRVEAYGANSEASYRRRAFGATRTTPVNYLTHRAYPRTQGDVVNLIKEAAAQEGVDTHFALAVAHVENRFNVRGVSWAGARCPVQVMPATARSFDPSLTLSQIDDPRICIPIGMRYLKMGLDQTGGSEHAAAARYEAGLGSGRVRSRYSNLVADRKRHPVVLTALNGGSGFNLFASYASPVGDMALLNRGLSQ